MPSIGHYPFWVVKVRAVFQTQAVYRLGLCMMIWLRNFVYFDLAALGIEPKALCRLGRGSTTQPHSSNPSFYVLLLDRVSLSCSG